MTHHDLKGSFEIQIHIRSGTRPSHKSHTLSRVPRQHMASVQETQTDLKDCGKRLYRECRVKFKAEQSRHSCNFQVVPEPDIYGISCSPASYLLSPSW